MRSSPGPPRRARRPWPRRPAPPRPRCTCGEVFREGKQERKDLGSRIGSEWVACPSSRQCPAARLRSAVDCNSVEWQRWWRRALNAALTQAPPTGAPARSSSPARPPAPGAAGCPPCGSGRSRDRLASAAPAESRMEDEALRTHGTWEVQPSPRAPGRHGLRVASPGAGPPAPQRRREQCHHAQRATCAPKRRIHTLQGLGLRSQHAGH